MAGLVVGIVIALLGLVLLFYASSLTHQINVAVAADRARQGLAPLPFHHFVDFARIAEQYVELTARGDRVRRLYAVSVIGPALFVGGGLLAIYQLNLPR